jgi:hypothetical protein
MGPMQISDVSATRQRKPANLIRWTALALALPVLGGLSGCITTAIILASQIELPPSCASLTSVERALTARCGAYKSGEILTKDVNIPVRSECALTNFARNPATWHGLPELLAKGAKPEGCNKAPLLAMAEREACPDFSAMSADTRNAVRWLAMADAASVSAPVMGMLSCPSARQAGLADVIPAWVAQRALDPSTVRFSPLSALHSSSLREPWVALIIGAGHQPQQAAELDASGFERALASGDVAALQWWTQHAPSLVHRVPSKGVGYTAWLPLARVMTPGFAPSDAVRSAGAEFLVARGANPQAALPHDRGETVLSYTQRVQPQLAHLLHVSAVAAPQKPLVISSALSLQRTQVATASLD